MVCLLVERSAGGWAGQRVVQATEAKVAMSAA